MLYYRSPNNKLNEEIIMQAAVIREPGGPEMFEIQTLPDPVPGPDEVLVEIKATALIGLISRNGMGIILLRSE